MHEQYSVVRFGRIGSVGQTQVKAHGDGDAAEQYAQAQVRQKERKGYKRASVPASLGNLYEEMMLSAVQQESYEAPIASGGGSGNRGGSDKSSTAQQQENALSGMRLCVVGRVIEPDIVEKEVASAGGEVMVVGDGMELDRDTIAEFTHIVLCDGAAGKSVHSNAVKSGLAVEDEIWMWSRIVLGEGQDGEVAEADIARTVGRKRGRTGRATSTARNKRRTGNEDAEDEATFDEFELEGAVICFTGALSRVRRIMVEEVNNAGGSVSNTVTGSTTHLVAGMGSEGTSKYHSAVSKGVAIRDEAWLDEQLEMAQSRGVTGKKAPKTKAAESKTKKAAAKKTGRKKKKKGGGLEGTVFCLVGAFQKSGRHEVAELLEEAGATVVRAMGEDVDYLLESDDGYGETSKHRLAMRLGINIVDEEWLREQLP